MAANGEDLRKLEEEQKRQRTSHSELKGRMETAETDLKTKFIDLKADMKWIRWLLATLVGVGLLNWLTGFLRH